MVLCADLALQTRPRINDQLLIFGLYGFAVVHRRGRIVKAKRFLDLVPCWKLGQLTQRRWVLTGIRETHYAALSVRNEAVLTHEVQGVAVVGLGFVLVPMVVTHGPPNEHIVNSKETRREFDFRRGRKQFHHRQRADT